MKTWIIFCALFSLGNFTLASSLNVEQTKVLLALKTLVNSGVATQSEIKDALALLHSKLLLLEVNSRRNGEVEKFETNQRIVGELHVISKGLEKQVYSSIFSEEIGQIQMLNPNDINTTAMRAHLMRKNLEGIQRTGAFK